LSILFFFFFLEAERRAGYEFLRKMEHGGYTPDCINQTMHFMAQLGMEAVKALRFSPLQHGVMAWLLCL